MSIFINHFKWFTVPLEGTLTRDATGKKSTPVFPANWRKVYSQTKNTGGGLLGLLTGKINNLIVVDCDNLPAVQMMEALDPNSKWKFVSAGKIGCSWVYAIDSDSDTSSFSVSDTVAIDFLGEGRMCYLPSKFNKTKIWAETTEYPEKMPLAVHTFLNSIRNKAIKPTVVSTETHLKLAGIISKFISSGGEYNKTLFKIITPKDFRGENEYIVTGSLHPKNVPEGRGSEYLSKVSAILGADESISVDMYFKAMNNINSMKVRPKPEKEFMLEVLNYMVTGKAKIGDTPIWKYTPTWGEGAYMKTSLDGEIIESFFDQLRNSYFVWNQSSGIVKEFNDRAKTLSYIQAVTGETIKAHEYTSEKKLVDVVFDPTIPFGKLSSKIFNLAKRTKHMEILHNPSSYENIYSEPSTTIKYINSLIPDVQVREYLLRFIRTKLTTFKHSPVIPLFIGVAGSGKDTFTDLLFSIVGEEYGARPDAKTFLETHNGFLQDKYFIQLDEYGDSLASAKDKKEARGRLKAYSGSPNIQIRKMGMDAFNSTHSSTFILTANSNPLSLEKNDRRMLHISTPNILINQAWVEELGGIGKVINNIKSEVSDFCYYLATEYSNLSLDEYSLPLLTEERKEMIEDSVPLIKKIVYMTISNPYRLLTSAEEVGEINNFSAILQKGRIYISDLVELYISLGGELEGKKARRLMVTEIKNQGVVLGRTSRNNETNSFFVTCQLTEIDKSRISSLLVASKKDIDGIGEGNIDITEML